MQRNFDSAELASSRTHASSDYTLTAYINTLKYWYAYQIIYPLSLATTKVSFLALYHRVFPPPTMVSTSGERWALLRLPCRKPADLGAQNRVFFWGTTAIIVVYTIIIMFVNVRFKQSRHFDQRLTSSGFRMSKPVRRMAAKFPESRLQRPQGIILLNGRHQHSNRPLGIDTTYKAGAGASGQSPAEM